MSTRIPLFPLRTVLFPHGILPLRIFETRYTDMIRRCLREQGVFGVVLIQQGGEVGEMSAIAPVGCSARIVDFGTLPDGLLSIVARGERRFRVLSRERQKDGLHVGEVEWLEDAPAVLSPGEFAPLRDLLARALEDLGEAYPAGEPRFDDAQWVSGHLGQVLPVAPAFRQQLLETGDALARLRLIDAMRREPDPSGGH